MLTSDYSDPIVESSQVVVEDHWVADRSLVEVEGRIVDLGLRYSCAAVMGRIVVDRIDLAVTDRMNLLRLEWRSRCLTLLVCSMCLKSFND